MGWPKGQKRIGYVKKDGQPHGKWGQALSPQVSVRIQELRGRMSSKDTGISATDGQTETGKKPTRLSTALTTSITKSLESAHTAIRSRRSKWATPLVHPTYIIEECPNETCGFPEADGGYCPECGWSKPIVYGVAF